MWKYRMFLVRVLKCVFKRIDSVASISQKFIATLGLQTYLRGSLHASCGYGHYDYEK